MKGERMRQTAMNINHPGALLALLAAAILAAGILASVGAKPARAADPSFVADPNSPFPVGTSPTTVTNADFNGDGRQDLAAQNFGTDNVSVLLGNGNGSFQGKKDFAVGDGPTAVISGHFNDDNADNKVDSADFADLAVANQNSNTVSVLLGNGDGTFQDKQDFWVDPDPASFRPDPISLISADFDGDAKVDLAVANSGSAYVSIMRGDGDGGFQAQRTFSIPPDSNQIITEDFDGDGKADLAVTDFGTELAQHPGGASVYLGNGDGTSRFRSRPVRIHFSFSLNSGDFDGDGKADLAVTGLSSSKVVSVALGDGDGGFQAQRSFGVGFSPTAVTSADFDSDGNDDLAVSNHGTDNVSVLFSNGDGTFQGKQDFPAGDGPIFVIGSNLNADDKPDLAVANEVSNNVSVLLNRAVDTTAPRVRSVSPAEDATGVARGANVEATFSEAVDPSTITDQTFTLAKQGSPNPVAARVLYDSASKKATLYPAVSLEADTSYTATIKGGSGGVMDVAGNALATNKVWTFSTVDTRPPAAPVITSPPNNSVDDDGNFTVGGTAEAKSTVELFEGPASSGTASADSSGNWSLSLTEVGEGSHTYTARARDAGGNTSGPSDALTVEVEIPPRVVSVSPADRTQSVAPDTNVEATFSEAMNSSTLNATTFTLTRQGSTTPVVDATVSYDEATRTATLEPGADLEANDITYSATIKGGPNGAKDLAGNALAVDKIWTFSIADTTAPSDPVITSPASDSYDSDGTFTVSGTAEAGSIVELSEGASFVGSVTASGSGDWSLSLGGVTQGEHTYAARAKDGANNTSGLSSPLKVTVDRTAPTVDRMVPASGARGVARGANITATFSDGMDPASLTGSARLYRWNAQKKRWQLVAAAVSVEGKTATLDPSSLLAASRRFKVTITTGAKNLAGLPLSSPKSWTFTTGRR